ncbi:SufD family Fe-S cluster assembly protein [Candidatus Roizmanbacteria bacterium]|nr:SufD family Fe-S cluster assembly protein [Candidatus Roizmanbacteria bacterium]
MKHVTFINLNQEKKQQYSFDRLGKYIVFFKNLSGKFIFELKEKGIELDIYGLFIGKKNDIFKIETIQSHVAPGSTSNLLIKGVFYDESKFIYQGLIRIEKKAQKSHAYQKNQNLIMSDKCFVDSRPFLEILANDVFCTHGSTTGKLNSDQRYYLETRGLDKKIAENLLIDGFIREIPAKIEEYGYNVS